MRLLGVLGGMGWSATAEYYRRLNDGVDARLGGLHSARVLIHSVDFQPIDDAENAGDWDAMAEVLVDAAKGLEPQTLKLFRVCKARGIPVITVINTWDRPGLDPLALMEEIQLRDGHIANASFTDYLLPTTLDMPKVEIELVEEPVDDSLERPPVSFVFGVPET